jgi:exodeoxyribonuclease V gamma subunit
MAPNPRLDALKAESDLTFKDTVPAFLDWALLRLQSAGDPYLPAVRLVLLTAAKKPWQDRINGWDEYLVAQPEDRRNVLCDGLRTRVVRLLELWRAAQTRPAIYFPKTSWAVQAPVNAEDAEDASAAAIKAWFGENRVKGERDYEPGYNALLGGEWSFGAGANETVELVRVAHELRALITLESVGEHAS